MDANQEVTGSNQPSEEDIQEISEKAKSFSEKIAWIAEQQIAAPSEYGSKVISLFAADCALAFLEHAWQPALVTLKERIANGEIDGNDPKIIDQIKNFEEHIADNTEKYESCKIPLVETRAKILDGITQMVPNFLKVSEAATRYNMDVSHLDSLYEKYLRLNAKRESHPTERTTEINDDIEELEILLKEFLECINNLK